MSHDLDKTRYIDTLRPSLKAESSVASTADADALMSRRGLRRSMSAAEHQTAPGSIVITHGDAQRDAQRAA